MTTENNHFSVYNVLNSISHILNLKVARMG